ncbi:MAG: TatD family hydrolase [Fibrobacterota bacterium]
MKLFDAHAHLQDARYGHSLPEVVLRAQNAGVARLSCCGSEESDWDAVAALAEQYDWIVPSFGLHPWYVARRTPEWQKTLECLLERFPRAGVGEAGLDHKVDTATFAAQEECLRIQLALAEKLNRPVSLHCRQAWQGLEEALSGFSKSSIRFLVHSFSGSPDMIDVLLKYNAYFSYSCSLTYSGNKPAVRSIARVPLDRLLLETDSPDLPPCGHEKELNAPANLTATLHAASRILNVPADVLAVRTYANACAFFGVTE